MNDIGLTALDLGLRGAASGLFVMMMLVLIRLRPGNAHAILGLAMSAGGAGFAIATAPFVPASTYWWTLPILSGQPVVFWLWARAAFDDDFAPRRWHGLVWLAVIILGFTASLSWPMWPAVTKVCAKGLSVVALTFALLAIVQTVTTWRDDLVARRRRLRMAVLILNLGFIAFVSAPSLLPLPVAPLGLTANLGGPGSFVTALTLCVLAVLASWNLFGANAATALPTPAVVAAGHADEPHATETMAAERPAVAPLLLRRLDQLMRVERIYRQEGLSIGSLAAQLNVPEYRLRQAINEGLGHRNFNAFLNRYRIDDAKAALSDPSQREVPVLTIAIDAGFQSIGPFNRAFKAATGLTPTEFRRQALGQPPAIAESTSDLRIRQAD
ncbi:AraC family transcriptional regulator [Bradyrhizobium oligotrophicum S58]|uniref:AraC family transcriptional regulator n=1 Tax=Bradyrhizobium oligotrophicum S58 TaxID=1245469 RepID=M4ZET6_9BRAD|nr:helix-turn-helix domain-containing protein [Bradyrhizobium oligotrophicum]BAM92328.1 AraC family transcriptional regulator [Bradyrhizobium oligotrophicum S58]